MIFLRHATTGDGLLTALRVLEIVHKSGKTLDALVDEIKTFPQKLVNIRIRNKRPLSELPSVQAEIQAAETPSPVAGAWWFVSPAQNLSLAS